MGWADPVSGLVPPSLLHQTSQSFPLSWSSLLERDSGHGAITRANGAPISGHGDVTVARRLWPLVLTELIGWVSWGPGAASAAGSVIMGGGETCLRLHGVTRQVA